MISNDNQQYLTVELFNSKMDTFMAQIKLGNEQLRNELNSKIDNVQSGLNSKIDSVQSSLRSEFQVGFNNLHNEIQTVDTNVQVIAAKNEMLAHTFYWGFAIMTLVITFVAVFIPYFIRERKEKKLQDDKNILSEQKVQDMITKTVDEAVAKALRNLGAFSK